MPIYVRTREGEIKFAPFALKRSSILSPDGLVCPKCKTTYGLKDCVTCMRCHVVLVPFYEEENFGYEQ